MSGAKQVHVFDKNADETIMWIAEKEALFLSEDLGQVRVFFQCFLSNLFSAFEDKTRMTTSISSEAV